MPRWDLAWIHDFGKVSELMEISDVLFSYLDFLHDNSIVHIDLHSSNTAINTIVQRGTYNARGLRDPGVTRYAVFDFGASVVYPYETLLESATHVADNYDWGFHGLLNLTGPFNPFYTDIGALGTMIEIQLRVIEDVVPQIVPFVDAMRAPNPDDSPPLKK